MLVSILDQGNFGIISIEENFNFVAKKFSCFVVFLYVVLDYKIIQLFAICIRVMVLSPFVAINYVVMAYCCFNPRFTLELLHCCAKRHKNGQKGNASK